MSQHAIVTGIARTLPTIVFGDPMQAIFGFGQDPLADWRSQIVPAFPQIGTLDTPWRWTRVGAGNLGRWLLEVRNVLEGGANIDLRSCPMHVIWHQLGNDANVNIQAQLGILATISRQHPGQSILVIGDSANAASRHNYASRAHGVSVVEPVEFRDVIDAVHRMNGQRGPILLQAVLDFLAGVMTNVGGANIQTRVNTIVGGRNRTEPTLPERAAITVWQDGGYSEAVGLLDAMAADPDRRVYRHSAYNMMADALKHCVRQTTEDLNTTIARLREQHRHAGRTVPMKAVGSTLLLKGLEADHVVVLDADNPANRMTREHLYVALTRGARSVYIFSRNPVLP